MQQKLAIICSKSVVLHLYEGHISTERVTGKSPSRLNPRPLKQEAFAQPLFNNYFQMPHKRFYFLLSLVPGFPLSCRWGTCPWGRPFGRASPRCWRWTALGRRSCGCPASAAQRPIDIEIVRISFSFSVKCLGNVCWSLLIAPGITAKFNFLSIFIPFSEHAFRLLDWKDLVKKVWRGCWNWTQDLWVITPRLHHYPATYKHVFLSSILAELFESSYNLV